MATEECIVRRLEEKVGRVGGALGVVAVCGRTMDAARRGRAAVEERRAVKRLNEEENVVADFCGGLWRVE